METVEARRTSFNWVAGTFLIAYHIALALMLPIYLSFCSVTWGLFLCSTVLYALSMLSITAGYHRLFSHTTYKAHPILEWILLFFGTMATQGSAIRWSFEHRLHHSFTDSNKDPYNIRRGFWYAHMLWLLDAPLPIDKAVVADLYRRPWLVFQHKYYGWLMVLTNAIAFLFVGWLLNDYVGAFVIAWWLRLFALHHSTWFINSLCHMWGSRSFSQEQTAVDNFILSLLTFGEGYHNYHHTFPNDYRNGIRWFHFDPSKWLIWLCSKCGLAYGLRRVNDLRIHKRMLLTQKDELLEQLLQSYTEKKDVMRQNLEQMAEDFLSKMTAMNTLSQRYYELKAKAEEHESMLRLKQEIREMKVSLNEAYRTWKALSKSIEALAV